MSMPAIKRTLIILFVLTIGAFAGVWIHFINESKELDRSKIKMWPLRVLAYPTFASAYGPGPELAKEFEKRCNCKVELLNAGDSALLTEKILAKGDDFTVDVVLGYDQLTIPKALESLSWKKIDIEKFEIPERLKFPGQEFMIPFDWAPLTFIYKKSEIDPPQNLRQLLESRFDSAVSLQNPTTSTPGRQFFQWIYSALGPEAGLSFFSSLAAQNFVFADTWSSSYGLFQKGPMKMSFSYLTSVVYHWEVEKNEDFQPAVFEEALPIQVEYMAVSSRCRLCEEAEDFLKFILEPGAQSLIMQKNYMFPINDDVRKGTKFDSLPAIKTLPLEATMPEDWMKQALEKVSE